MSPDALAALFREGLSMLSVVSAPMLGAMLVVGLGLGVLQSATQIQEPAVSAVPRLAAVVAVTALFGPWMVERLARFLTLALERIAQRPF